MSDFQNISIIKSKIKAEANNVCFAFDNPVENIYFVRESDGASIIIKKNISNNEEIVIKVFNERVDFIVYNNAIKKIIIGIRNAGEEKCTCYSYEDSSKEFKEYNSIYSFSGTYLISLNAEVVSYAVREDDGSSSLLQLDLVNNSKKTIYKSNGICFNRGLSIDGKKLLFYRAYFEGFHEIVILDIKNKIEKVIHKTDSKNPESIYISWNKDCTGVFAQILDIDNDKFKIALIDIENLSVKYIDFPDKNIHSFKISPNRDQLIALINDGGFMIPYLLDIKSGIISKTENYPKGVTFEVIWSWDSNFALCKFSAFGKGKQAYLWSVDDNSWRQFTFINSDELIFSFSDPILLSYKSFDNLDIPYILYLPKEASVKKPVPLIVNIHGGPKGQARPESNDFIEIAVSLGYAVITPNIRGSGGFGAKYASLDDGTLRINAIKDIEYLHTRIQLMEMIDKNNIILSGQSYGGYMTLTCLALQPTLWKAGVDQYGMSSLVTFLKHFPEDRRKTMEIEYGSLENDLEFLKSISPLENVDKINAPVFIAHGIHDKSAPFQEAVQMNDALKGRGKIVEFLQFDDEEHGFGLDKNLENLYLRIFDFIEKHLTYN